MMLDRNRQCFGNRCHEANYGNIIRQPQHFLFLGPWQSLTRLHSRLATLPLFQSHSRPGPCLGLRQLSGDRKPAAGPCWDRPPRVGAELSQSIAAVVNPAQYCNRGNQQRESRCTQAVSRNGPDCIILRCLTRGETNPRMNLLSNSGRRPMSRKSKRKRQAGARDGKSVSGTQFTTREMQTSRRSSGRLARPASSPCCWPPSLRPGPGGISSIARQLGSRRQG